MDFLGIAGKVFLVFGVANRKSVAWHVGQILAQNGATVLYSVRSEARKQQVSEWIPLEKVWVCDVEHEGEIERLRSTIEKQYPSIDGIVHSIAFANFSDGWKPFYETKRADFLQAATISCFSLVEVAKFFKTLLSKNASVVTMGISSQVAAVHYGYMSPIKAALESTVRFLAKSFSADSEVRFNAVGAGPLKTSASAGIPGFLKNYLFAEQLTLRKRAITTTEVANAAVFLLSPSSSGINGQTLVVNAGMDFNYFDETVVEKAIS
ncbi:MAG: SDR family oxidoreductase [Opitutales bacterium]|nr:SDR family oxidoreductase [Opitutales bacterium]